MAFSVALRWQGVGHHFRGGKVGGPEFAIDGDGAEGPSPVTALVMSLAGCMAIDVLDITQKMRLTVTSLETVVESDRRDEPPKRVLATRMRFMVKGVAPADREKVQRAIDLSREKFCSVLHSLREDIDMSFELVME
jgi:putative redox protein